MSDAKKAVTQLLYMGFEQAENVRRYIFHRVAHGEDTKVFMVSTDLALLQKNHVGFQEGPALCLRVLAAEMEAEHPQRLSLRRALTDTHIQAYLIARAVPSSRKSGPKPKPRSSHPESGLAQPVI